MSGEVVGTTPRLAVRVTLTNRGETALGPIDVTGELFGEGQQAQLRGPLAPGASADVVLEFERGPDRPGLHALTLLAEHPLPGAPDAAGNPPLASERAWLLLALGASPGEAVRIESDRLRLDVEGALAVRVSSRDGAAHRVRLRALAARGLRTPAEAVEVEVPATGQATVVLPVVRAGAPRGSRHGLVLVAETPEGPIARTSVAAALVEIEGDRAWLPRVRAPLAGLGVALVLLALGYEIHARRRGRGSAEA